MISRGEPGYEATLIRDAEPNHLSIAVASAALPIESGTYAANDCPFENA